MDHHISAVATPIAAIACAIEEASERATALRENPCFSVALTIRIPIAGRDGLEEAARRSA